MKAHELCIIVGNVFVAAAIVAGGGSETGLVILALLWLGTGAWAWFLDR